MLRQARQCPGRWVRRMQTRPTMYSVQTSYLTHAERSSAFVCFMAIISWWAYLACLVSRSLVTLHLSLCLVRSRQIQRRIPYQSRSPAKAGHKHLPWQRNGNIAGAYSVRVWLEGRNSELTLGQTASCSKWVNKPKKRFPPQFLQCCFISLCTLPEKRLGTDKMSCPCSRCRRPEGKRQIETELFRGAPSARKILPRIPPPTSRP